MPVLVKRFCVPQRSVDGTPVSVPIEFLVVEANTTLTHARFEIGVDGTADECEAKAQAKAQALTQNPWVSPFVRYAALICADYGGAQRLGDLCLSLYNGEDFPFDVGRLGYLDRHHFEVALELISSYHQYGENDGAFLALGRRLAEARTPSSAQAEG